MTGAADALRTLADALAGEQLDERLLQQGPLIEDIERAQNQIASDQRDLPRREVERRIAATRIDNALAALGLRTFDEISTIIPNGPQIAAGRDLRPTASRRSGWKLRGISRGATRPSARGKAIST
ncbi:MAG: hypothetical protein WBX30_14485, partial [Stellaceae bacterium]